MGDGSSPIIPRFWRVYFPDSIGHLEVPIFIHTQAVELVYAVETAAAHVELNDRRSSFHSYRPKQSPHELPTMIPRIFRFWANLMKPGNLLFTDFTVSFNIQWSWKRTSICQSQKPCGQHAVLCQSLGFADLIIPCEERGEHEAYSSGLECVA